MICYFESSDIPSGEIEGLMEEVRLHDPRTAPYGWRMAFIFTVRSPGRQWIISAPAAGFCTRSAVNRKDVS